MSIVKPASHCPGCKSEIKWYDNIPMLSYILLLGKCRSCKMHIPFRYTAVELANTLLWLACVWRFWEISPIYAAISAVTMSVLICVFFIDLEHMLIFDRFQIILLLLAVGATVSDVVKNGIGSLYSHLIGGVAGFLCLYLIAFVALKILGREGLGGGDIKLCGVMGLYLGWQKLLFAVLISSFVASVLLLILKYKKREDQEEKEYPFAPFLTAGFAVAMLFGDAIISGYVSLII